MAVRLHRFVRDPAKAFPHIDLLSLGEGASRVSDKPICNICPLGNYGSFLIALFVIIRWVVFINLKNKSDKKGLKLFSIFGLLMVFLLSLLNFNAVVYLLPYFIVEAYIIREVL